MTCSPAPCTPATLDYVAQFLAGVARSAQDTALEQARDGTGGTACLGCPPRRKRVIRSVLRQRLTRQIAI